MIYYSENPLKTWQPNLIMLDLEDDLGHIYVTRNTYDQAVLIADRFNHDAELVANKLGCVRNQEDTSSYMVAVLPDPINILTPFYHLIDSNVKLDPENTRQAIGVLSYMSMSIDFNMMLKVPYEVRANLVFTKSILLDYQRHFEDFNFRILDDSDHIRHEEGDRREVPRSEKETFSLSEEPKQEEINLDTFFQDIGWNDIPIPSLTPLPDESAKKDEPSAPIAGTNFTPEKDAAAGYMDIINKFM